MRISMRFMVLAGALVCAGTANADHICTNSPNEVHVANAPDPQGNLTVPICRWNEVATPQAAPPQEAIVRERWQVWEDRYGAIAIDEATGAYGIGVDAPSVEAAEEMALKVCFERGGRACRVLNNMKNGCITLAWGAGKVGSSGRHDAASSQDAALKRCEAQAGEVCDVIETTCSPPVSYWSDTKPANFVPAD